MIDPENPVVQLCQQGMHAEAQGKLEEARAFFARAWEARQNPYDACIAAHYLARHQETHEDTLYWNQTAIDQAAAVGDDSVRAFYPSLLLNLGWSYEQMEYFDEARLYYEQAAARLEDVPTGPYRDVVEGGIQNGLRRTQRSD